MKAIRYAVRKDADHGWMLWIIMIEADGHEMRVGTFQPSWRVAMRMAEHNLMFARRRREREILEEIARHHNEQALMEATGRR